MTKGELYCFSTSWEEKKQLDQTVRKHSGVEERDVVEISRDHLNA